MTTPSSPSSPSSSPPQAPVPKLIRGYHLWFCAISLWSQMIGIILSSLLIWYLTVGDKSKHCSDSYFTRSHWDYYGINGIEYLSEGCKTTTAGKTVLIIHLVFDCIFALYNANLLAYYMDWTSVGSCSVEEDRPANFADYRWCGRVAWKFCCSGVGSWYFKPLIWLLLPVINIIRVIVTIPFYVVYPKSLALHAKAFIIVGAIDKSMIPTHTVVVEVLNLFTENLLEVLISLTLYATSYNSWTSILFSIPSFINTTFRILYYVLRYSRNMVGFCSSHVVEIQEFMVSPIEKTPASPPSALASQMTGNDDRTQSGIASPSSSPPPYNAVASSQFTFDQSASAV